MGPNIFDAEANADRPIAVVDLEASSLPMPGSYPIEVAVAYVADATAASWLIRPTQQWLDHGVWDPASERVHGISRAKLLAEGCQVNEVRAELARAVAGHVVYSDAVASDAFWLWTLYGGRAPIALEPIGDLVQQLTAPFGAAARDRFLAAMNAAYDRHPQQHRAAPDACRLAEMIRILKGLA